MNTQIPSQELNTEETLTLALSIYSGNFGTLFIPFLIGSLITAVFRVVSIASVEEIPPFLGSYSGAYLEHYWSHVWTMLGLLIITAIVTLIVSVMTEACASSVRLT